VSETVELDPASEDKLTSKIAEKLKGLVAKREEKEAKEDEKLAGIADFIDQEIGKRVDEKLAEKTTVKPPETKEEKLSLEKTPEERVKELEAELAKLKTPPEKKKLTPEEQKAEELKNRPPPPPFSSDKTPAATVNQEQVDTDDLPQEVLDAIDEVTKNPIAGYATILEYLYPKGKRKKE